MYTVFINGVPIQCDTAQDAIELTRQAAAEGMDSGTPTAQGRQSSNGELGGPTRWNERRIREFFGLIQGNQRKLVDILLDAADGQLDTQLQGQLNLQDNRGLAGVLAGLYKNARRVGADPNELYEKDTVTMGEGQQYEYRLVPSFRAAARKWRP